MNKDLLAEVNIEINVDKEKVWEALLYPEKIELYNFGEDIITDWKVGSEILFRGEYNGYEYTDRGIVIEIKQGELCQYLYWSNFSGLECRIENYSVVRYKTETRNNKTLLSVSIKGFLDEQKRQFAEKNWASYFQQLKQKIQ